VQQGQKKGLLAVFLARRNVKSRILYMEGGFAAYNNGLSGSGGKTLYLSRRRRQAVER